MTQPSPRDDLAAALYGHPCTEQFLNAYRAAVLREAADAIDATFTGPGIDRYTRYGADLLRRMAEEARS